MAFTGMKKGSAPNKVPAPTRASNLNHDDSPVMRPPRLKPLKANSRDYTKKDPDAVASSKFGASPSMFSGE